jgi:hypothetical protein
MSAPLPTLPGVSPGTLDAFLKTAAGNWLVQHNYPPCLLVRHKGRCVEVKKTNGARFPPFNELAEHLVGGGNTCEDFDFQDSSRYSLLARLKTDAQREADSLAFDIDETHGYLYTNGFMTQAAFGGEAPNAPAAKVDMRRARKSKKRPRDGTNELVVLKAMEKEPGTELTEADLYDIVAEDIEAPRSGLRKQYLRNALKKLSVSDDPWIWKHGEVYSLASVPQGEDIK